MSSGLVTRRAGSVVHLVLSAPQRRNALSRSMLEALEGALGALDEDVVGVVISGCGDAFSAGADFEELTGSSADLHYDDAVSRVRAAVRGCDRLVVAAVEGPCVGAAADLALACDVRVAAADSYLQIPAVGLGLLYNPDVISGLAQAFPLDAVRRLLLLGERLDAPVAAQLGLVTEVVPTGEAVRRAEELMAAIPPDSLPALAATKAVLAAATTRELPDSETWQHLRRDLLDSPQRRAAVDRARARHTPGRTPAPDHRPTPIER